MMIVEVRRWWAIAATFKDHVDSLNRRASVETILWNVAAGKRPMLTQDECRKLALKLGVPSAYQNAQVLQLDDESQEECKRC